VIGLTKLPQLTTGRRRHAENEHDGDDNGRQFEGRAAAHRAIFRTQDLGDLRMVGPSPTAACTDTALKVRTKIAKATAFRNMRAS